MGEPVSDGRTALLSRMQKPHPSLAKRQKNSHGGPASHVAFDLDLAAMIAHDPLHNHQAQPAPFLFGREVWLKHLAKVLLGDAAPAIPKRNDHMIAGRLGAYVEDAAFAHRLDRIADN